MANNQYVNKVDYAGQTIIDLTADTVSADKLLSGYTAHDRSGSPISGTYVPSATVTETLDQYGGTIVNISVNQGSYTWEGKNMEFVQDLFSHTYSLSDTSYGSWNPSESAASIKASSSSGVTFAADPVNYDYLIKVLWRTDFAYNQDAPSNAKFNRLYGEYFDFFTRRPSSYVTMHNRNYNALVSEIIFSNYLGEYHDAVGNLTSLMLSSVNGIYISPSNVGAISSAASDTPTITVQIPPIYAKCSGSSFSTTAASKVDVANTTITITEKLYRFPLGDSIRRQSTAELINWYLSENP